MQSLVLKGQGSRSVIGPEEIAIKRRTPNSNCGLPLIKAANPSWTYWRKSEGSILWLHSSLSLWYLASISHWPAPAGRQKAKASLDFICIGQPPRHRAGLRIIDVEGQTKHILYKFSVAKDSAAIRYFLLFHISVFLGLWIQNFSESQIIIIPSPTLFPRLSGNLHN